MMRFALIKTRNSTENTSGRSWGPLSVLAVAFVVTGCDAFAEPGDPGRTSTPPGARGDTFQPLPGAAGGGSQAIGGAGGSVTSSSGLGLHVADTPPPPIQGGTLEVLADGTVAAVADPARDRVSFVDLETSEVFHVELQEDDMPGRIVEDDAGRAHVALRGSGEIVTIDVAAAEVRERRTACGSLRGLAFHADEDALLAACANGELVTLPSESGEATRRDFVADDLRDVWVQQGHIQVSRFKTAEVLSLDSERQVMNRAEPQQARVVRAGPTRVMAPTTAWRVANAEDGAYMIHQSAQIDPIDLGEGSAGDAGAMRAEAADGGMPVPQPPSPGGNPYGGGDGCGGIVRATLDRISPEGELTRGRIGSLGMAVDVAPSPDGEWLAFALPGHAIGSDRPLPISRVGRAGVVLVPKAHTFEGEADTKEACQLPMRDFPAVAITGSGQATAVAFDGQGRLLVQSREPASLSIIDAEHLQEGFLVDAVSEKTVDLGGESVRDTGHDLFHMITSAGIACASCHPGGAEDGHIWRFRPIGPRRSQALHVGLEGSAPFHWDGDQKDVSALMNEVFVRRMGGHQVRESEAELLRNWMFDLEPPAPKRSEDDPAVQRGKALFESDETRCTSCHSGPKLTNNATEDVGTGGAFQVPSLVGVAYRAPLMHDGCAENLHARFLDLECGGGDAHGKTTHLDESEVDDLVAYLESL